jgi:hypothetical protein
MSKERSNTGRFLLLLMIIVVCGTAIFITHQVKETARISKDAAGEGVDFLRDLTGTNDATRYEDLDFGPDFWKFDPKKKGSK